MKKLNLIGVVKVLLFAGLFVLQLVLAPKEIPDDISLVFAIPLLFC